MIDHHISEGSAPILFVHSALGTNREMQTLAEAFGDRTTMLLDLPMHGASAEWQGAYTPGALGEWLMNEVSAIPADVMPGGTIDVIGYSMGGYVALQAALLEQSRNVRRIRSVAAHAMKFYWTPQAIETAVAGMDHVRLLQESPKFLQLLEQAHTASAQRVLAAVSEFIESFRANQLTEDMLALLDIPLLLTTGERDEMVPATEVTRLGQALRERGKGSVDVVIFEDVRHPIKTLPAERFRSAVLPFLEAPQDSAERREIETI
jgi:pimeloyl-ACP methyl ester carboxylesterase